MKIVLIHGQSHEGSTCHIARMLSERLSGEVKEFFLPKDFGEFCIGCSACFADETRCPHYEKLKAIAAAMDEADVLILASPVYVYHVTGAMKAFLDHYGYRQMAHRPEERMFSKQAVVISTAAGAGMKCANRDMADSAFYWGCARVYKLGIAVREVSWSGVNPSIRARAERKVARLAHKLGKNDSSVLGAVVVSCHFNPHF